VNNPTRTWNPILANLLNPCNLSLEFPGCIADGENQIEAINNVNTIINEWIETAIQTKREIPIAKGRLLFA